MILLTLALFIGVTFFLAPAALYALAAKLTEPRAGERGRLFLLVAPLGPIAISLLLMAAYSVSPIPAHLTGPILVLAFICGGLIAGWRELASALAEARAALRPLRSPWLEVDIVLLGLLALVVVQAATLPLMGNDALEYMAVARHIFEQGSLAAYPVLEAGPNGLFAPASHPPAYHMYLVWGFLWAGTANFAPMRLLALFNLLGTAALLVCAVSQRGPRAAKIAIVLLLTTPLYISVLVDYHIDSIRLLTFLAAAIAVADLIETPNLRRAALTGGVLGAALFSHSIGVLALAFGGLAYALLGPPGRFRSLAIPLVVGAVALAVGGSHYVKNLILFGTPLHDSVPVWEMPEIDFASDLRFRRGLVTTADRLVFGAFRGLVDLSLYGILFWLLLPAVLLLAWWWRTPSHSRQLTFFWGAIPAVERVATIWIAAWVGLAVLSAVLGSDLAIKNPRYLLTFAPLAICVVTPMIAQLLLEGRWSRAAFATCMMLAASWMVLQSVVRTVGHGGRLDLVTTGERAAIYREATRFPGAPVFRHLEENYTPGERTLVFRQADFALYGTGPWIDNFDTALMPLYRLRSAEETHRWLRERNVRFALLPPYNNPTLYRTAVGRLLADPSYVDFVMSHRGYRLLQLLDRPRPSRCVRVPEEAMQFSLFSRPPHIGLLSSLSGLPLLRHTEWQHMMLLGSPSDKRPLRLQWAGGQQLMMVSGSGALSARPQEEWLSVSRPGTIIRMEVVATGKGLIGLDVMEYTADGEVRVTQAWDGVVDEKVGRAAFLYRLQPGTVAFKLAISNLGQMQGAVDVSRISLCHEEPADEQVAGRQRKGTPVARWEATTLTVGCARTRTEGCVHDRVRTFVREVAEREVRLSGEVSTLLGPGFRPTRAFTVRRYLERVRVWMERHPESGVVRLIRPVYRWVDWLDESIGMAEYQVRVSALGAYGADHGISQLYVQWKNADGSIDWRWAGTLHLTQTARETVLPVLLPAEASEFAIGLVGRADFVALGPITLERLDGEKRNGMLLPGLQQTR